MLPIELDPTRNSDVHAKRRCLAPHRDGRPENRSLSHRVEHRKLYVGGCQWRVVVEEGGPPAAPAAAALSSGRTVKLLEEHRLLQRRRRRRLRHLGDVVCGGFLRSCSTQTARRSSQPSIQLSSPTEPDRLTINAKARLRCQHRRRHANRSTGTEPDRRFLREEPTSSTSRRVDDVDAVRRSRLKKCRPCSRSTKRPEVLRGAQRYMQLSPKCCSGGRWSR